MNGVSSNTITCITQDKKGFMWFGTRNGLNRFDGTNFKIFRSNIADVNSIGNNSILSLSEDNRQQLWVGTYKGIYVYNPQREKFTAFGKLPPIEIRFIEVENDNVWIVANGTTYKYSNKTGKLSTYFSGGDKTISLKISGAGEVWIATEAGKLKKYDGVNDRFTTFDVEKLLESDANNQIQDIYPLNKDVVLVGTMRHVRLVDTKNFTAKPVLKSLVAGKDIQVHKIIQKSASEFWFGSEDGLYIYNAKNDKAEHLRKQYDNPYALTDNVISSFWKDTEGGIWIGTFFGGINYYSPQYNRFQKYFPNGGRNNLSGNLVHEICADDFGNVWVGTEDAGLNRIDKSTGEIKHFLPGANSGISYQNLHGIVADNDKLWIGTYEHGIDVMDIRSGKVISHFGKGTGQNDLKGNFIVTIYKTRSGDILVGTWNGMFVYNKATDGFTPHPFVTMQTQGILEDNDGTLWIASYGNGVYFYNPQTGKSGNFRFDPKNPNSLPNNYVNSLYKDSRGNYWFCTESGLCKYEASNGKFTRVTNGNGITDNQVFKVLEDNNRTLWISTSKGLYSLDPTNNAIKPYTTAHGLLTDQCNYNSGYKTKDGTLYFGSVKGMISFNPALFPANAFVPPVYITGLQINNKEVPVGSDDSPLLKSILYTDQITVSHDNSNISIEVAALSFSLSEMNEYDYKMDGVDKQWTRIKGNRKIYYTKLPPGNYTFRVKGSNSGEVWNNNERTLSIKVLPPWWSSWWAYLLYVTAVVLIAGLIIRYYLLALKEKNKRRFDLLEIRKEREIHHAKVEFFTNIAHEIRTPLTLIKMPLEKLLKKEGEDEEVYENLRLMNKNTNRLIDLTNQLLDFRKAESNKFSLTFTMVNISGILKEVYSTFKPAAEQKNIDFKLEMPRLPLQAFVDNEAFRKIITNLFSNAIKYADRIVTAKLLPFGSEDDTFSIEFKNDGSLVPFDLKEKIFEPFYRLKETERVPGTGIGLALSRALTELHKGILDLKQPEGNLNVFVLTLPIHQDNEIVIGETGNREQLTESNIEVTDTFSDSTKATLLIVEDNKEISDYITKELKNEYNILRASNGEQALEVLIKETVQLVISDIMMPVMDGIELVKRIKTDIQYSHIPIVLLTAKNTLESKIQGLEVGADAYIEKPFSLDHLRVQVNNLLTNRNLLKKHFTSSPLAQIKGIAYSKPDKDFIERLNEVIYENITNIDLDVDELSKLMNMSRPTLYRKIKALSDLTPNELINLTRLKKASELLAEGNYKIAEVANMVGYTLATNFSRDFNKQFSMSPSQYVTNLQIDSKGVNRF